MEHISIQINSGGDERNIIIINYGVGESIEAISDNIYTKHPQRLTYCDCIVVRFISPPESGLPLDKLLKPLIDRASKSAVLSLSSVNYQYVISENLNPHSLFSPFEKMSESDLIRLLREEEMYDFLINSNALFKSNDKFIFRSPSKQYCSAFLRVGNIQVSSFQIDSIFFWLLPYMKDVESIITDTWSISSIALNIGRRLQLYNQEQSQQLNIQMLSSYYSGLPTQRVELERILRETTANGHKKTLFLISAVLTGNSVKKYKQAVSLASIPDEFVSFVALYYFDENNIFDGLCNLTSDTRSITIDTWRVPPADKIVVDIDSCTYAPSQMEEKCVPISIDNNINNTKDFFNQYQGTNSVSLHRDSKDTNQQRIRHHFIYIDVNEMLKISYFKQKLEQALLTINPPPSLIIVPPHEAGLALLEYARAYYKKYCDTNPLSLIHPDLDFNDEEVLKMRINDLDQTKSILILDDVTTTGARLSKYQQHLRDSSISFKGQIHYLIGVARPPSEKAWKRRVRDLEYRDGFSKIDGEHHKVTALENLLLPDWNELDCPWCHEESDLSLLLETIAQDPEDNIKSLIHKRLRKIINARNSKGLINNAIWRDEIACHPKMTDNSIFYDENGSTDADIVTAASSAMQSLRKNGGLGSFFPYVSVLDDLEYLGETYNDLIIKLALIRSCRINELVRWKDDDENKRIKAIENLFREGVVDERDVKSLYLEFSLNILSGKLPSNIQLSITDDERLINLEKSLLAVILKAFCL